MARPRLDHGTADSFAGCDNRQASVACSCKDECHCSRRVTTDSRTCCLVGSYSLVVTMALMVLVDFEILFVVELHNNTCAHRKPDY